MSRNVPLQVSGFGALTALGDTVVGFEALLAGRDGFGPPPEWVGPPIATAATVRTPLVEAHRTVALAHTLLASTDLDPDGLAVVFATTTSAMYAGEEAVASWVRGEPPARPIDFLWTHLTHWPAVQVAERLGATGPAVAVSTACTSGTVAIGVAADLVRAGRCRRALVVGADALCRTTLFGFNSLGAYTSTRCRPMDQGRDGMAIGEAAAWLLLEPLRPGARFALVGVATTTDAGHLTAPDPEGGGVVRAVAGAIGGEDPAGIDHVNAHATATPANDAAEAVAIRKAAPNAAVSATKGATGHTLGAAGVVEAVLLLQSMAAEMVPPVVGLTDPIDGVNVSPVARERRQRLGVSVNLAFGGHNAAVAFRKVSP